VRPHDDEISTAGLSGRNERFGSRTMYDNRVRYDAGASSLLACGGTDNSVTCAPRKIAFLYVRELDIRTRPLS
jgi:hypothetical protein